MKTDELREKYLEFFVSKGCTRKPSDVLVPRWDPSVLFTPAGMNQFKDHFLGKCKLEFTRATTCQKCLRTGDIDNVGRTAYHHTFFEMLGNFSFGDYFKREAINWAWEFLTDKKWLGLPKDQLTVSVYLDDDEAAGIWQKDIGLSTDRIERMGEDDNFWPAGAPTSGPDGVCGPCSEIFFHPKGSKSVEIWNLVFTQFNRVGNPPNNLRPLPSKNIDTGMGLERIASVMQGVETNYHIDILRPLVEAAADVCGRKYDPSSDDGRRLRRIADHVRACSFAVHENVYPDTKKQGYVIRRLLRRAVLDGRQMGLHEPFLHKLVTTVADLMKGPYPELQQTTSAVAKVIEREEAAFFATIDAGLHRVERVFEKMRGGNKSIVPGADAFDLYQTYGFPPELFDTISADQGFTFDWDGFRAAMKVHAEQPKGDTGRPLFETAGPIDNIVKAHGTTKFLGYETVAAEGKILGVIDGDHLVEQFDDVGDRTIALVLDQTPFYGESGGQIGDTGEIRNDQFAFEVVDSKRKSGLTLHIGHLKAGVIRQGTTVSANVDAERRQAIRRAHSATHLMHYALQKHVSKDALQRGSKVSEDELRFDFGHPTQVPREKLVEIENEVNAKIAEAAPIDWKNLPIAEARGQGAMMLFGEKYPDVVRMVSMGDFSKELCGGTHLDNTGQVGLFKIVSEENVAAGTRRITAVTGRAALERTRKHEHLLHEAAAVLKAPVDDLPNRVAALAKEVRDLKKQLATGVRAGGPTVDQMLADAATVGATKVVAAEIPGGTAESLRAIIDQLRQKTPSVAALLGARDEEGKVVLVAGITNDLQAKKLHAGNWVKAASTVVGGSGGGRPDMAQAGGKLPEKLPEALAQGRETFVKQLAG
jgi:alanyl-tRNA synthetase